ncbi:MAG: hypothetical protein E7573_02790 [Ruminococcaceae bacterium]|nr:hypothetical protein [Oscillospiraceae bacterium]
MKVFSLIALCVFLVPFFGVCANASENMYDEIFDVLSPETEKLLESFGITGDVQENFTEVSVEKAFDTVLGIFRGELISPVKYLGVCLALMFISSQLSQLFSVAGSVGSLSKRISLLCVMFSIVSMSAGIFSQCSSSLLTTKDMMLVLIPIFAGVVSFGGDIALAMSFNTVAFSFAETVAIFFNGVFPLLCTVMTAVTSASAINPLIKLDGVGKTLSKAVNVIMAFISGIFVAVLSIRGVIAGAADTVAIRGVRFIIGNSVPVVGSAIGEALNSVVAGISLMKNTVGMVGIAAVIVINLPVIIKVAVWKGALYFISLCADMLDLPEIRSFSENMNGVLSVITGALFFVSFVFIISIAIILTVSKG